MDRLCKQCSQVKPYDPTPQKANRKASGFWGKLCWSCHIARQQVYYATPKGRAKCNAASTKTRATPEGRSKARQAGLAWAKKYPEKNTANVQKHTAAKLQRIPQWASLTEVACFYAEAVRLTKLTGVTHVVDHIIPLRGKLVSGLHVETNLQVLTKAANSGKSNRMPNIPEAWAYNFT